MVSCGSGVGTARTSPFALIEVAFLAIAVALICSYESAINDEALYNQNLEYMPVIFDIGHGLVTGLSIFFATLACSAALHREIRYIRGCYQLWRGKNTESLKRHALPGVERSVSFGLLVALGLKTALILLVFNIVVPFLTLKVSKYEMTQVATDWIVSQVSKVPPVRFDSDVAVHGMILKTDWWILWGSTKQLASKYIPWSHVSDSLFSLVFRYLSPETVWRVQEFGVHMGKVIQVVAITAASTMIVILSVALRFLAKLWCLVCLQGTVLFPFIPYTYYLGPIAINWIKTKLVTAWSLVSTLPLVVLFPWISLTAVAMLVVAPLFTAEASILRLRIGGGMLPLVISTLMANHVASLLVFDVVRICAALMGRHNGESWDTMMIVTELMESRRMIQYFRAFQVMTAVGITLVVLLASYRTPTKVKPVETRKREVEEPRRNSSLDGLPSSTVARNIPMRKPTTPSLWPQTRRPETMMASVAEEPDSENVMPRPDWEPTNGDETETESDIEESQRPLNRQRENLSGTEGRGGRNMQAGGRGEMNHSPESPGTSGLRSDDDSSDTPSLQFSPSAQLPPSSIRSETASSQGLNDGYPFISSSSSARQTSEYTGEPLLQLDHPRNRVGKSIPSHPRSGRKTLPSGRAR